MRKLLPFIAVSLALLNVAAASASPATVVSGSTLWTKHADAVCVAWQKKVAAAFGAHPQQPSTAKGIYEFMVKARPIEAGELNALRRIHDPRPSGAAKALALAAADLRELDAGIAAYRAGDPALFLHDVNVWQSDHRTHRAFLAVGARACG
jgi:hypothetical protein